MSDNVFAKIIKRELPAKIIYEDDKVIAFMDAFPEQEGHFLVVPKQEAENMMKNSDDVIIYAFQKARELAKREVLDKGIPAFKLVINNGYEAGQRVFQTHIHIIPYK
ncbi:histidine triad protein HinT [Mycoplasmopsis alligatoris]|uniref:Histidine triad domain protein n=1 Tax=Mycoplasmopsis alligatoris A21JP2 TaxID=747682 RepID=D4XWL9_9BACT|nr:HIT domain-containing protein [Mycoplasmopsis alligatoris]EFF41140.1 histidine triad domain protein [Mycoplasmopsis alligatoris A21JP2]